jgi:hypothetical protein
MSGRAKAFLAARAATAGSGRSATPTRLAAGKPPDQRAETGAGSTDGSRRLRHSVRGSEGRQTLASGCGAAIARTVASDGSAPLDRSLVRNITAPACARGTWAIQAARGNLRFSPMAGAGGRTDIVSGAGSDPARIAASRRGSSSVICGSRYGRTASGSGAGGCDSGSTRESPRATGVWVDGSAWTPETTRSADANRGRGATRWGATVALAAGHSGTAGEMAT